MLKPGWHSWFVGVKNLSIKIEGLQKKKLSISQGDQTGGRNKIVHKKKQYWVSAIVIFTLVSTVAGREILDGEDMTTDCQYTCPHHAEIKNPTREGGGVCACWRVGRISDKALRTCIKSVAECTIKITYVYPKKCQCCWLVEKKKFKNLWKKKVEWVRGRLIEAGMSTYDESG